MPLTESGKKTLAGFKKKYGKKEGESYFYASIKKGIPGSRGWHESKGKRVRPNTGKNRYTGVLSHA